MEPLIQKFSKNLSGCGGCGSNGSNEPVYDTWLKAKQTGEKMKFQIVIVVDADTYKQAINKIPDDFEILTGGVKPEPKPATQGIQTGGQFSRTITQPTPLNG
jgi:hypothetical protein